MRLLTTTFARVLFALPIAIFGIFHFMNADGMKSMVPSWLPGGVFWVYITGVALIAAAVSIAINKKAKLAGLLLAVLILIFVLTIHLPAGQSGMPIALRDIGLMAGALIISGISKD